MASPKLLITAGCSFSQVPNNDITWPVHLKEYLQCDALYLGQGAAGNGIISKKVIYHTLEALKSYNSDDILVCIMWSGTDRKEFYLSNNNLENCEKIDYGDGIEYYRNPMRISKDIPDRNYYITNVGWSDHLSKTYYKNFHDNVGAYINTLENILRVQWFLETKNVKYFMTQAFANIESVNNPDVKYLHEQIDISKWLNIANMSDFALKTGFPFARKNDDHPSTRHHKTLVEQVIVPHLKTMGYI